MKNYGRKIQLMFLCVLCVFFVIGCGKSEDTLDLEKDFNVEYEAGEKYEFEFGKVSYKLSLSTDNKCYMISNEVEELQFPNEDTIYNVEYIYYYVGTYSKINEDEVTCDFADKYISVNWGSDFPKEKLLAGMVSVRLDQASYMISLINEEVVRELGDAVSAVVTAKMECRLEEMNKFLPTKLVRYVDGVEKDTIGYDGEHCIKSSMSTENDGEEKFYYNVDGVCVKDYQVSYATDQEGNRRKIEYIKTYYEDGTENEYISYTDGVISFRQVYDKERDVYMKWHYGSTGLFCYEEVFIEENGPQQIILEDRYVQDENGEQKRLSRTEYLEGGITKLTYFYDADVKATSSQWINSDGKCVKFEINNLDSGKDYIHDVGSNGGYFEAYVRNSDMEIGGTAEEKYGIEVFLYDVNGNITEGCEYTSQMRLSIKTRYDTQENPTSITYYDASGEQSFHYEAKTEGQSIKVSNLAKRIGKNARMVTIQQNGVTIGIVITDLKGTEIWSYYTQNPGAEISLSSNGSDIWGVLDESNGSFHEIDFSGI